VSDLSIRHLVRRETHLYPRDKICGGLIATVAILGWLVVIRESNRLGGKKHYVSPGSEGPVGPSERLPMDH
jgi:hypothetical protein